MPTQFKKQEKERVKQTEVEKLIDLLIDDLGLSNVSKEEIRLWLSADEKSKEKSDALLKKFSDVFQYEEEQRLMPEIWPEILRRTGIEGQVKDKTRRCTTGTETRIPLRRWTALRVAAVLMPFLIVATAFGLLIHRTGDRAGQQVADVITISVPAIETTQAGKETNAVILAENAIHTLPDNSTVRLGKGSEMHHAENFGEKRHVTLKGEARFRVTKALAPQDKFTVHTEHLKIAVLGTEFRVHSPADERHSTIELYHGSVEVEAGGRKIVMAPRDHLHYDHATKQINITRIPLRELSYEIMPGLVFESTPVMDIVSLLEKDYGVRFRIEGTVPSDPLVVEGDMTSMGTLDKLLSTIQMMSGRFTYEMTDDEVIIKFDKI